MRRKIYEHGSDIEMQRNAAAGGQAWFLPCLSPPPAFVMSNLNADAMIRAYDEICHADYYYICNMSFKHTKKHKIYIPLLHYSISDRHGRRKYEKGNECGGWHAHKNF